MFGFHLKENTINEINKLRKHKCNLIQIFPDEIEEVEQILTKNKITNLKYIIHSSFIINISQPFRPKSYTTLKCIEEIKESIYSNIRIRNTEYLRINIFRNGQGLFFLRKL